MTTCATIWTTCVGLPELFAQRDPFQHEPRSSLLVPHPVTWEEYEANREIRAWLDRHIRGAQLNTTPRATYHEAM